jgi:hypothetical protein
MRRIDVHHHFFPTNLNKQNSNQSLGWRAPAGTLPWSPEISLRSMDASGVDMAVLSLPALYTGSICEENRVLARERNIHVAQIVQSFPSRFGFFASLPFLDDIEGWSVENNTMNSPSNFLQVPCWKFHMHSTCCRQME